MAHARARDAVQHSADLNALAADLVRVGLEPVLVASAAPDRTTYLQRPDLGRRLSPQSREALVRLEKTSPCDLVLVIADGLSGFAVEHHAAQLAATLSRRLLGNQWRLASIVLVRQGRVAIGDEIGELFQARIALVLIGERPGLSSPDSLGAYLTWDPRVGRTDAERNCVSNIRPEGLPLAAAVDRLVWLLDESRRRKLSGVALKDLSDGRRLAAGESPPPSLGRARSIL
jgi:ethanolamine ammonia-lyase small subunit